MGTQLFFILRNFDSCTPFSHYSVEEFIAIQKDRKGKKKSTLPQTQGKIAPLQQLYSIS
jgi:hypothetical protein